ncbi:hypothetical protein WJX72_004966 [[Myrmecia] bisecta]|uniref:Non-structural maintenance of chromosomes element 1 homolog n=1 Tax=[Myrmecia] bisecta TaxID=41462 RepID=A0AAW1QQH3_9CHLO
MMVRGWLPEADARSLYKQLLKTQDDSGYELLVADINASLTLVQLQLRRLKFQLDDVWYVGLVNLVSDDVSKQAGTQLTHEQLNFYRTIIEAIALLPDAEEGKGEISSTQILNLSPGSQATQASQAEGSQQAVGKKLTMAQKQETLLQLVKEGWLWHMPGRAGYYSIGVRTFLEMPEYLMALELPDETRAAWEKFL